MLRALQAYEAAARHENYSGAAAELNVTPAAIGQQVRALEAWLGVTLFRRLASGSNRLVLTSAAAEALPELKLGFDHLDAGLRRLRQSHRQLVTVAVSQAFVARWLFRGWTVSRRLGQRSRCGSTYRTGWPTSSMAKPMSASVLVQDSGQAWSPST